MEVHLYNQVAQEAEAAGPLKRQYSQRKYNLLVVVIVKHCSCVVFKIKKIVLGIICQTTKHILQTVLCCSRAARQGADSAGNRKCLVQKKTKKKKEMLILFEDDSLN